MMHEQGPGPDRIIPSDVYTTSEPDGCVKLRMLSDPIGGMQPKSIPTIVKERCSKGGNSMAMAVKRDGNWIKWTYKQYYQDIRNVAKAFIKLGLDPYHSVCVLGFNSPEWFLSDIGAIFAGGFIAGLYPTNSAETNRYIINDARCQILVVEDETYLKRLYPMRNEFRYLKKIVQYTGVPSSEYPDVLSWSQLIDLGLSLPEEPLEGRISQQAINQCCTLVYTSGTTGNPKGVMISQDNIYFTTTMALKAHNWEDDAGDCVSYLPLNHIAANMYDIWASMFGLGKVWFAQKTALKGTLVETLKECRPTRFFGVPRVWEKIREAMMEKGRENKGLKKQLADSAKKAGLAHHNEGKNGFMFKLGEKLVYPKVREALGLDRCKEFVTGAAPLAKEVFNYFLSLDMEINELYGMSESTGPFSANFKGKKIIGSVGVVYPGTRGKINDPDPNGDGEICMWGRHIMMGYLNNPEKTAETIDEENWLHSGDIGRKDNEGFYYITGRIKELLITAGGENIAPVLMEDNIKAELPCISNAILIGDKKKFITVFLTFKTIVDKETDLPTNQLTVGAIDWMKSIGSSALTVDEILKGPDSNVMSAIQKGIDRANSKAISNATRVQRWTILPRDISIPNGELGPTLKLKRFFFNNKYAHAIENLYKV